MTHSAVGRPWRDDEGGRDDERLGNPAEPLNLAGIGIEHEVLDPDAGLAGKKKPSDGASWVASPMPCPVPCPK